MAILDLPIPDVDHSVLRNTVLGVMQDFIDLLHLPTDTKIIYPGIMEEGLLPNAAIGNQGDPKDFGNRPRVVIEVRDRLVDEEAGQLTQAIAENRNILVDDKLGVYLRPHYSYHEVELTIRATFKSAVHAKQWADNVSNHIKQGRQLHVHKASYHYRIPPVHMAILKEIHRLRENVAGYGEDFDTWFQSIAQQQVTKATTANAGYWEYVVAETMSRIQGNFGFVLVPDETEPKSNKTATETTIQYVFNFDKIDSLVLTYPIVVHNQVLSSKYRERTNSFEEINYEQQRSQSLTAARHFEAGAGDYYYWRSLQGVAIPSYDDFIPKLTLTSSRRIFTGIVNLADEAPGTTLLNFHNLGRYTLKESILNFLKESEYPYITRDFGSVFQLHLYRGYYALPNKNDPITVDENLTVRSNRELSFRDPHRLRFSLVTNLRLLDKDALERLKKNKDVLCAVLHAIHPTGPWDELVCNNPDNINWQDLENIIEIIEGLDENDRVRFNTVGTFFIQTQRKIEN